MIKLSLRAKKILAIIRERGLDNEGNEIDRFYVPNAYPEYIKLFSGQSIVVYGSGDAVIIKSLCKKGLVTDKPLCAYACEITKLGIEVYNSLEDDKDVRKARVRWKKEQQRMKREDNED